jgi:hypothetical protein
VVNRARDAEAGKVRLGCVVTLLILAAGIYVGVQVGEVQWRWYQIKDAVKEQASFATALDDQTIRARLMVRSDQLGLPYTPRDWVIRRSRDLRTGRTITIEAPPYTDSVVVNLPGLRRVWYFTFTPSYSEAY